MLNGSDTLSMGWLPETGFIKYRWDVYAEMLTMLLMAIGASRNAIPPTAWNAVTRPIIEFGGIDFISGVAPSVHPSVCARLVRLSAYAR